MIRTTLLRAVLAGLAVLAPLPAQSWTKLAPANNPPGRDSHGMCTDTTRNVVVLFGHNDNTTVDTWEYDGKDWAKASPTNSPPAISSAGLSYDGKRGVCVLFGGRNRQAQSNQTWEYDGKTWTRITTTNTPPARYGHAQCYDSQRGVTVVFGGLDRYPPYADTWEYDGKDWKQVATTGPSGRVSPAMAFDALRSRCVLFGGYSAYSTPADLADTWEWDGSSWTPVPIRCPPEGRWMHAMAYVLPRGVVLFGGLKQQGTNTGVRQDTWLFDGSTWAEVQPTTPPSARRSHAMAPEPRTSRVLLFGGSSGPTETHAFDLGAFRSGSYEPFGTGCPGTNGTPALAAPACGAPWVNAPFTAEVTGIPTGANVLLVFGLSDQAWGPAKLPMDWSFMGFTSCSLLASLDLVLGIPTVGTTATLTTTLPNDVTLGGVRFYNQAFVFDRGANPAGATLSNGCAATVGRR